VGAGHENSELTKNQQIPARILTLPHHFFLAGFFWPAKLLMKG